MHIQKLVRITKGNNSHRNGPYNFIISICPVDMNQYARFDEIPSMTYADIMEKKRYGRTDNVKTVYPPTNTVCVGYKNAEYSIWCARNYCPT